MQSIKNAATDFLSHKRIAVTGVSRNAGAHGSNAVYQRLPCRGYEVFPVNPSAEQVEGDTAYLDLTSIPGAWRRSSSERARNTPRRQWRSAHNCGSSRCGCTVGPVAEASPRTPRRGRAQGMTVIDGGCPLMFEPTSDPGHKVIALDVQPRRERGPARSNSRPGLSIDPRLPRARISHGKSARALPNRRRAHNDDNL
jgi:hypothetical protein